MTPCREWQGGKYGSGYGARLVAGKQVAVHRWAWEQVNGPIPKGMMVMHICDNPPCYRYDHLRLGTHAENQADKITKGRHAKGVTHGRSKLTEDQVREIYASTETCVALASKYGVGKSTISYIRTDQRWKQTTREGK